MLETNVASLQQEARKVDLVFDFTDPFGKHRLNLNGHVKSGNSCRAKSSNADRIKLKGIDEDSSRAPGPRNPQHIIVSLILEFRRIGYMSM